MGNPRYIKAEPGKWAREGVRAAVAAEMNKLGSDDIASIKIIIEAMEWPQLIVFSYDNSDRVVAPFVVGVSSDGKPLMRGYQLEGVSRSGRGEGWRVFQVGAMLNLENHQDYFEASDFDFNRVYPWIYKVFRML
jgi:hypothetical protein